MRAACVAAIAELCSIVGKASAMVFAMHQIKLSSVVEHGVGSGWHRDFMRRIAKRTASGIGGNLRDAHSAQLMMSNGAFSAMRRPCCLYKQGTRLSG